MYRPGGKGNEWVPLYIVTWTWQGSIKYVDIKEPPWIKLEEEIPKELKENETSDYPTWDKNTCGKWKCSDVEKKRPWQP